MKNVLFDESYINKSTEKRKVDVLYDDFIKFYFEHPNYDLKKDLEDLWIIYKNFAHKSFKNNLLMQNKNSFHNYWWEMFCGVGLFNMGFQINTLKNNGPDFKASFLEHTCYIECIAPTIGNTNNSFPSLTETFSKNIYVIDRKDIPENKYLLRLTSALETKKNKFNIYINKNNIIKNDDYLIIAISDCNLGQWNTFMDTNISAIDKILFGINYTARTFDGKEYFIKQSNLTTHNNTKIEVDIFDNKDYDIISGIIYCNQEPLNANYKTPERTLLLRENPNAKNKIPKPIKEKFINNF